MSDDIIMFFCHLNDKHLGHVLKDLEVHWGMRQKSIRSCSSHALLNRGIGTCFPENVSRRKGDWRQILLSYLRSHISTKEMLKKEALRISIICLFIPLSLSFPTNSLAYTHKGPTIVQSTFYGRPPRSLSKQVGSSWSWECISPFLGFRSLLPISAVPKQY